MKENNEEIEGNEDSVKPTEYVKELLKEKLTLNPEQHSNAMRLVDQGKLHRLLYFSALYFKFQANYCLLMYMFPFFMS